MNKRNSVIAGSLLAAMLLTAGIELNANNRSLVMKTADDSEITVESLVVIEDEMVALAASPNIKSNDKATIDYTTANDGYISVTFTAQSSKKLKVQVKGPSTTYTYNIKAGKKEYFPMSDGDGTYQVGVFEQASGNSYSGVLSEKISVKLKDELGPYMHSNQYVDYENAPNAVKKAEELCKGEKDPLKKVAKVYDFVVKNVTYDKAFAQSVQSGYVPTLDNVLKNKKGICFDYASLMTGMLRSQGVPCKLVIGYAGTAYHAWINVWSNDKGWVNNAITFDGKKWNRMDPTYASSSKESKAIMTYIGDGKNYSSKYTY